MFLSALFFYYNEQLVPAKVVDCYFAISNHSTKQYPSGFLLAAFMFETDFYAYLPLLMVVNQMSKFISNKWVIALLATNTLINSFVGKQLVD